MHRKQDRFDVIVIFDANSPLMFRTARKQSGCCAKTSNNVCVDFNVTPEISLLAELISVVGMTTR